MAYLYISDYKTSIQALYFQQLVQGDDTKRVQEELSSLSICKSRLQQKYDVSQEFTDTLPWVAATTYLARGRVIIDYAEYDATITYAVGALRLYNGIGYSCSTAIVAPEAFNAAHWTSLGAQYTIYFCSYPPACTYPPDLANPNAPVFNINKAYNLGDIVYWKGYTYTCTLASVRISANEMFQFYTINNLPFLNVFPDDTINNVNSQFWGTKTAYSVPAGTLPTNTTYWTQGDNREQQLVKAMKNITIYNLSPLISPKNCPVEWEGRYKNALMELRDMANGGITVDIPLLQPPMGRRVRFGGFVKTPNNW